MYDYLIYPLEHLFRLVYTAILSYTASHGAAIVGLSLVNSALIYPLGRWLARGQERERELQAVMRPQLTRIERESTDWQERHRRKQDLYTRYGYHPIYSLRSVSGVLVQVPFFLAAYHMLSSLPALSGQRLWFLHDLGRPDALLGTVHALPLVMTAINLAAAVLTPHLDARARAQSYIIAGLFLVILYASPSALVLYWTLNNIVSLGKAYVARRQVGRETLTRWQPGHLVAVLDHALAAPVVALATVYLVTRYIAAQDNTAKAGASVVSLLLAVVAGRRYARLRPRFGRALLVGCALAVIAAYVGRGLMFDPFAGWRDVILATQAAVAALLFALCYRKRNTAETIARPARVALVVLAALAPALMHASNNLSFLPGAMVIPYLLSLVAFALVAYGVALATADATLPKSRVAVLAAGFVLAMFLLPSVRGWLRQDGKLIIDFFVYAAIVVWGMSGLAKPGARLLIIGGVVFVGLETWSVVHAGAKRELSANIFNISKVPPEVLGKTPLDTPNVYLLVYDGIPEFDTLAALGFDASPNRRLFEKYRFKLYPGTYSLASSSLSSMAATVDMHRQLEWPSDLKPDARATLHRTVRGGFSTVNHLFQHLGYTTYAILSSYDAGDRPQVNELWPKGVNVKLDLASTLLRGVLQGEFRHDTKGWAKRRGSKYYVEEKLRVFRSDQPRRYMESHINVPSHSQNSGRCREDERELWGEAYRLGLTLMERDFAAIEEHDPGALVIAISDHGPDLTGDCSGLYRYALTDITRLALLDRYSTMVAIRWPDAARAAKYDGDLLTNQDIFPIVFAYLFDSPVPLRWKVPRVITFRGHVFLREREFFPYTGNGEPQAAGPEE